MTNYLVIISTIYLFLKMIEKCKEVNRLLHKLGVEAAPYQGKFGQNQQNAH